MFFLKHVQPEMFQCLSITLDLKGLLPIVTENQRQWLGKLNSPRITCRWIIISFCWTHLKVAKFSCFIDGWNSNTGSQCVTSSWKWYSLYECYTGFMRVWWQRVQIFSLFDVLWWCIWNLKLPLCDAAGPAHYMNIPWKQSCSFTKSSIYLRDEGPLGLF